jgi:hypothetical protein
MPNERTWEVGDQYDVVDNGQKLTGTIDSIDEKVYHVSWRTSEGSYVESTVEDKPDPMMGRW